MEVSVYKFLNEYDLVILSQDHTIFHMSVCLYQLVHDDQWKVVLQS